MRGVFTRTSLIEFLFCFSGRCDHEVAASAGLGQRAMMQGLLPAGARVQIPAGPGGHRGSSAIRVGLLHVRDGRGVIAHMSTNVYHDHVTRLDVPCRRRGGALAFVRWFKSTGASLTFRYKYVDVKREKRKRNSVVKLRNTVV